jgi:predicted Zn-dependent protease
VKHALLIAAVLIPLTPALHAQKDAADVETRAMRDEMARSVKDLHLEGTEAPYFISYKITDTERKEADASLGALTASSETRSRTLSVTVRVGNYDSDSSGVTSLALLAGTAQLPLDDNYEELRRRIWIATDNAYKAALESLASKKAAAARRSNPDRVADFSKEPARQETETLPPIAIQLADLEHTVRVTSAELAKLSAVESGEAHYEAINATERFLNSEGTTYLRQVPELYFHASASTQRETGQILTDAVNEYGRSIAEIPNEDALVHETAHIVLFLNALDKAHSAKQYSGPVLFEGQAAAELFGHSFANLLTAKPATIGSGNALLDSLMRTPTASLLNKMGSRVLPDFLSVTNNPTLAEADGHKLLGAYQFDEEGTPAQETTLVKDGILKTLLSSRTPVRGIDHSTGSMRERGILPGNIFVTSAKTATLDEMKQQLLDLVKTRGLDSGIIVRRLNANNAIEAYRILPDGREQMLRFAHLSEITPSIFRDILAASDHPTVLTARAQTGGLLNLFSRGDLVTYVVPSLLFEDISIVHSGGGSTKPTVIPSPN